ncbi:EHMT1-like protein [Mya arenaria]|uniref:EHMT1-like protein n=1 Tax=Mya arenaria TaxID=6604 RepID=A0ABY7GB61_MYAAR|nr:EHMT1-like protein [Mya arenaria]
MLDARACVKDTCLELTFMAHIRMLKMPCGNYNITAGVKSAAIRKKDCPSTGNGGADVETQSKCLLATSQLSNGDLATISEQHSRENMAEESNGCQEVDHIIEKLNSKENIAGADLKRLKGVRKKKGRRLGGYKLPGEKKYKKRESEERQTGKSKKEKEEKSDTKNDKICSEAKTNTDICVAYSSNVQADLSKETKSDTIDNHKQLKPDTNSMKNGDTILVPNNLLENPQQMNALEMLTKNAKRSFASASSTKKAKKTVRQGIDPLTHRTLDSFLRAGSHSQLVTSGRKIVDKARPDKSEGVEMGDSHISEHQRKRKASGPMKVVQHVDMDTAIITPEEKKQRLDGNQPRPLASPVQTMARSSPAVTSPRSPQLLTTLKTMPTSVSTTAQRGAPVFTLLTSSPPRSAQTSGGGTQSTLILAAGSKSPSQTILQRGMLNGLPMFQIVSNQTIVSSSAQGQAQYVTLAQSQTKSELTSSSKMSLPSAVPVLFTPVQFSTAVTSVVNTAGAKPITTSLLTSIPSTYMPPNNFMVSSSVSHSNIQKDHSVLKQKLKSKIEYRMPNGQFLDARHPHGADHRGVPNGLYPVTPPRTPPEQKSHSDEQRSETESQGEIESSASGSATSDKDVVPLCTCKISGTSFQKMASNVTFCQALDSVDGKVLGCCNKVTNPQLVRPAVKIPFLAVCEHHRKRLRSHQCCPGCGHFCTQGRFLQCTRENSTFVHHFHEACQVSRGDGKNLCPHCGEASSQYEVSLTLPEGAKMKARIGLADRRSASVEKEAMEETAVSVILDKTKKTISTKDGHDPRESYDDLEGQSALHAAAAVGSLPIVHVLIQAGASPHVQDIYLKTPLMFAAESNHIDVTYYLIKANATVDAKAGHLNVINILLDTDRIPIDTRDDGGWTPLIWAAEHMEMEAVKLLLKRKADPNLRDTEENTTMHWAAFSGSVSIAEQLLSAGCDLDSLNMHGDRPLHIAARQDHYECVVGIPTDYLYVTDNIETMCLQVNRVIGSLQTCQCKDDCSSIYCACGKNSLRCWYDKYGRLAADFNMQEPPLLFECNRACECWTTCNNRVPFTGVQNSRSRYIGEHISDSEADRREDDSYLFDLDNKDGETYCIDARRYGNVARFINHLCEPNLVPVKVFVDSQDLRFPRICLFASRDIKAQEELGFDYGEKFWIIKWKQFTCTCGSEKCRYSNDTIQKTLTEYRQKHELDDPID